ncbi:hypothetical protein [Vibrio phage vB_VpaM_XM1]
MDLIRITSSGENITRVTVSNGHDTYRFIFIDGNRGGAEKELKEGEYRGLPCKTHRSVRGPKRLWDFAEKMSSK